MSVRRAAGRNNVLWISPRTRVPNSYNVDVENPDVLLRPLLMCPDVLYLVDNIETLDSPPKDRVLVIKPRLESVLVIDPVAPCQGKACLTVLSVVTKNWLPFEFGPAFAMLTVYGLSCFKLLNSSAKW